MFKCSCIFFLFLLTGQLYGQTGKILFNRYTQADGLSHNNVLSIKEDKRGFLWVGTINGLNRFDGKRFRKFFYNRDDSNGICGSEVRCITEDKDNMLWLGTENGLCKLNPLTTEFKKFSFTAGERKKIKTEWINSLIQVETTNTLWAGGIGLFFVNSKTGELDPAPGNINDSLFYNTSRTVFKILADKNRLWLATTNGLIFYDINTHLWQVFNTTVFNNKTVGYPLVYHDMFMDKRGTLWATTWGLGLVEFDTAQKKIVQYNLPSPDKAPSGLYNILFDMTRTNYAGEDNTLWVSGISGGLHAFDLVTKKFTPYTAQSASNNYGVFMEAHSTFFSEKSGLWIGGQMGLYQYDRHQQLLKEVSFDQPEKDSLDKSVFYELIYADPLDSTGNTVWIGTDNKGLYKFNMLTRQKQAMNYQFGKMLPSDYYVTSIYRDREKNLWVSTLLNGLLKYDEKNKKTTQYTFSNKTNANIKWIEKFIPDKTDTDILWVGTSVGLFRFNKKTGTSTPAEILIEGKDLSASNIADLCSDDKGNIWFTGWNELMEADIAGKVRSAGGLTISFEPVTIKDKYYKNGAEIAYGAGGKLFVNTWHGIFYWSADEKKPVAKYYNNPSYTAGARADYLIGDRKGNVWIYAANKIYLLDGVTEKLNELNFAVLQNNAGFYLNENQENGQILGGTWFKFYTIQPAAELLAAKSFKLFITGIKTGNQYYNGHETDFTSKIIYLPYDSSNVTIEFTSLNFLYGSPALFSYKMEGYDKDWTVTGNTSVNYSLPYGTYKFLLKGANSNGIWGEEIVYTKIIISPPFYKTWWFICLIIIAVALLLYALYRYRINQLLRLHKMRNTISRNLHDEIGSTLTSISILSTVSQQAMDKDPEQAKEMLQKISQQSKTIQQNMSDIVWAIRAGNDTIENLLVRMREYAAQTLEPLNIKTSIQVNETLLNKALTLEARKEVLLIFKEAVVNIAKHSGASSVNINLLHTGNTLLLEIKDNGKWKGSDSSTGTGMGSMQQRAVAIGGNLKIEHDERGTSILLSMPIT